MPRKSHSLGIPTFANARTSVMRGPFEFDLPVLTSALRLSTTYDYPDLRSFSLEKLEQVSLSAVERVRFAREFDIPAWEEAAYVELCERDEAISPTEASALGMDAFVQVARIREMEQRRRGEMVNATTEARGSNTQGGIQEVESGLVSPTAIAAHGVEEVAGQTTRLAVRDSNGELRQGKETKSQVYEKGEGKLCVDQSMFDY